VASNRGPVAFSRDDGHLTVRRGGGGVVSGLSSVASQEDLLWVCAALSDADRSAARQAPDGLLGLDGSPGGSAVRMLDIPAATFNRAYNTVANSVLWFIHHMLYDTPNQPQFGHGFRRDWEAYREYNIAFAQALAGAPDPGRAGGHGTPPPSALIQDYHLTLAPRMLAELRPGVRIAHFSHTPWAPVDYFRLLPDAIAAEVLEGILGADHAGFLSQRWADAFIDCCEAVLAAEVDRDRRLVHYQGHTTGIGVHPLGVDAPELTSRGAEPDVEARMATLREQVGDRKLIVRVDRTELSKNIVRGLAAYRELLLTHPEWQGKVMMLALAYPSRHDLPEYREYAASVQRLATAIDDEFGTPDWSPVLLRANDDYPRSLAGYRLADVLLVNPIRDGMNLVAKEGPILSDHGCVLVLSREAGAADELGAHALMVNPFDVTGTAAALHEALLMPQAERMLRCRSLAQAAGAFAPTDWFASQLDALDHVVSALADRSVARADRGGEAGEQARDALRAVDDQVRLAVQPGDLGRGAPHRQAGQAVGSEPPHGPEGRQVTQVVSGEHHRRYAVMPAKLLQGDALVGTGRPELDHEPARFGLQAGLPGEFDQRGPDQVEGRRRIGGPPGVDGQRVGLVLDPCPVGRARCGENARQPLARDGQPGRRWRRGQLAVGPALPSVLPEYHDARHLVEGAVPDGVQRGPAGDDGERPDQGRQRLQRGDGRGQRPGLLGIVDDGRQGPVEIQRDHRMVRIAQQRVQARPAPRGGGHRQAVRFGRTRSHGRSPDAASFQRSRPERSLFRSARRRRSLATSAGSNCAAAGVSISSFSSW
jgi:trehalose 6-phosphate synthase